MSDRVSPRTDNACPYCGPPNVAWCWWGTCDVPCGVLDFQRQVEQLGRLLAAGAGLLAPDVRSTTPCLLAPGGCTLDEFLHLGWKEDGYYYGRAGQDEAAAAFSSAHSSWGCVADSFARIERLRGGGGTILLPGLRELWRELGRVHEVLGRVASGGDGSVSA